MDVIDNLRNAMFLLFIYVAGKLKWFFNLKVTVQDVGKTPLTLRLKMSNGL